MILLSVAAGWAISSEFDRITCRTFQGPCDLSCYRNEFAEALDGAIRLAGQHEVSISSICRLTKADVSFGAELSAL